SFIIERLHIPAAIKLFPTYNILVFALAAGITVSAIGNNIVFTMSARASVNVWPSPGVVRQPLFKIRPLPFINTRIGYQRSQALLRGGVAPDIQPVLVERLSKQLDLGFCSRLFTLTQFWEKLGTYQCCQKPQNHKDYKQFHESKSLFI